MGRVQIDAELLDQINGGNIGFNPDSNGNFTMKCQYSGQTYQNVALPQVMEIAKYAATVPNTAEGEQQIVNWAHEQGII